MTATVPSGELHVRSGPLMAAADTITVTVNGRGGHASAPQDALDPVPAAAAMVRGAADRGDPRGSTPTSRWC